MRKATKRKSIFHSGAEGGGRSGVVGGKIAAIMLDRDGVVNRELGRAVRSWDEFEFLPGVFQAFQQLAMLQIPVVVLSNQSAIGRGWVSSETVDAIHREMMGRIRGAGGRIDDVMVCPHAPESECSCRKPKPGLLLETAIKHRFDLRWAVMVGDSHRDIEAAQAANAIPLMVRSGHAIPRKLEERLNRENVRVVADLVSAVTAIANGSVFPLTGGESRENL
jgi:D-glycero-D-manno-heptose 1,7-bisphosphate phosphatase